MANTETNSSREQNRWNNRGTVAGLFTDHERAEQALQELKQSGIPEQQIGLATSDSEQKTQASFWDRARAMLGDRDRTSDMDQFRDSLEGSGIPDTEGRYFSRQLRAGQILVTVHTDPAHIQDAVRILQKNGGDIADSASATTSGVEKSGVERSGEEERNDVGRRHIELLGEVLRVHKERVSRGEVAIRKEVVTEQQHIEVPVTREELVIERHAVNERQPTNAQIGRDQEIRIPLTEEEVRVEKRPVVREEVNVGTKKVQETRQVADTTRREELKVDKKGDVEVPDEVENKNRKRTA
jgi:uncharacterized protein (TIGR02271 family)